MSRVGVFICHCGENIAGTVDVAAVAKAAMDMPGVVHAVEYKYMCSDPGQTMLKDAIVEKEARRRGRGRLLAAHARADLSPHG
jgi:heterodisulfide reductase subunit A